MGIQVIVLNGGSSSGKTGIARCLQVILPGPWLRLGVDDLIEALPPGLLDSGAGLAVGRRGEVTIGEGFRELEAAWTAGIGAMARAGAWFTTSRSTPAGPRRWTAPAPSRRG